MSLVFNRQTNAIDICRAFAAEIKGRTVLLTGPTPGGVGYTVALDIAEQGPALMVLVGRSLSKLEEAREGIVAKNPEVKVELVQCDLGNLASVRKAAEEIISKDYTIDYLIANAAIMDAPFTLTDEGFELQLVTNYLSNYVLLGKILTQILRSEKKTIVLVSSGSHALNSVQWDDPYFSHTDYGTQKGYAQSKSAVILYARALAKQYGAQGLRVLSPTPGPTPSNLSRHWTIETKIAMGKQYHNAFHENGELNLSSPLWKTLEQGAATIVRAAFDKSLPNGVYMNDCNAAEAACAEWAKDPALIDKIQAWTDNLLKAPK